VGRRSPDYTRFLRRLRAARERAGLTQAETARRLGKGQAYVWKSEVGERRVDAVELKEFARVYGVSITPRLVTATRERSTSRSPSSRLLDADAKAIRRFLRGDGPRVVFATYQSSLVLAKAMKADGVPPFDLAIADEAHRFAGPLAGDFATPARSELRGFILRLLVLAPNLRAPAEPARWSVPFFCGESGTKARNDECHGSVPVGRFFRTEVRPRRGVEFNLPVSVACAIVATITPAM
jgi:transcriptional regulator with XRE-family HTH domain